MSDPLSFKEEASKLIKHLATEIEGFFLLSSFLFALDAFLYRFDPQHRTVLSFDWTFAHGVNIGSILLFLALFSFTMTVVVPLLSWLLRMLNLVIPKPRWLTEFFASGEKEPDWASRGYVTTSMLLSVVLRMPPSCGRFSIRNSMPTRSLRMLFSS